MRGMVSSIALVTGTMECLSDFGCSENNLRLFGIGYDTGRRRKFHMVLRVYSNIHRARTVIP